MELLIILGIPYMIASLALVAVSTALRLGRKQEDRLDALSEKVVDLEVKVFPQIKNIEDLEGEDILELEEDDFEPLTFEEVKRAAESLAGFLVSENGGLCPEWLNFVAAGDGYIMVNMNRAPSTGFVHTVWNRVPVETTFDDPITAGSAL